MIIWCVPNIIKFERNNFSQWSHVVWNGATNGKAKSVYWTMKQGSVHAYWVKMFEIGLEVNFFFNPWIYNRKLTALRQPWSQDITDIVLWSKSFCWNKQSLYRAGFISSHTLVFKRLFLPITKVIFNLEIPLWVNTVVQEFGCICSFYLLYFALFLH